MGKGIFKVRPRAVVLAGFVATLAMAFVLWPTPQGSPPPSLPSPNGYDIVLGAARKVPHSQSYYKDWSHEELAAFVQTNAAILDEARAGLTRPCQVPIEYSSTYFSRHLNDLSDLKLLAQSLAAAGRLAELENRPTDAARFYLDCILLGQQMARGGTMIDHLVGIACENVGAVKVEQLIDTLDVKSARGAMEFLRELDTSRPSIEAAILLEREWERRAGSLRERVSAMWAWKSLDPTRKSAQKAISKSHATIRQHRLLMLKLAARIYEIEQHHKPARADQLVPVYLRIIPKDPESGADLTLPASSR